MDTPKLNLYQKLLEIQKRVVGLGKDKKSFSFEYVTGAKVLEHIKPLMNEYGLLLKQEIVSFDNTRQDYNTAKGAKSEILTKVVIRFTWIDCETGEKDVNEFGANGQNDWDKGIGSALTYAERYFLLKFFHIATDEDDIDNPELKKQAEIAAEKVLNGAIKEVKACTDKECTVQVWNKYPQLKEVESFKSAVAEKGKSFTAVEAKAPERPANEPTPVATEKQKDLIRNLLNSHHVPISFRDRVQDIESNYEGYIPLADFETIYKELQELIAWGTKHEAETPATSDQIELIEIHLANTAFKEEEAKAGKAKLAKGYTIAQANKRIKQLEGLIEERSKAKSNAA
ncbi:hypothetical protein FVR03_01125 [Pontibacter qinzhouensis]|uniref:Single-stranded DNA-binding protein n=1 Tax=Pontibacter qinzhouensis TaxID=2603253 RepID=A0A5C8KF87_9BACT|nr:ERF family protein [Pontibacter qinzhouensis]TXK52345.1 hypothetical protein FVR03_01125 [Pontibacter qinzhouensis]